MTLYQRITGGLDDEGTGAIALHAFKAAIRLVHMGEATPHQMATRFGLDAQEEAHMSVLLAFQDIEKPLAVLDLVVDGFMTVAEGKTVLGI